MKAVEFESELIDNTIKVPENFHLELALTKDKHVRVIVLIADSDTREDIELKTFISNQFVKGYDETDSVYDNI